MTTSDARLAEQLEARLREHGYRVTEPRRRIWNALHDSDHATVEMLAQHVGDDIDIATVYRTLSLFEQLGMARMSRFHDADAGHWEVAHPDEHFHLVCTRCGSVDHHVGTLVKQIEHHLFDGHGFEVASVDLTVSGLCATCRERDRSPSVESLSTSDA